MSPHAFVRAAPQSMVPCPRGEELSAPRLDTTLPPALLTIRRLSALFSTLFSITRPGLDVDVGVLLRRGDRCSLSRRGSRGRHCGFYAALRPQYPPLRLRHPFSSDRCRSVVRAPGLSRRQGLRRHPWLCDASPYCSRPARLPRFGCPIRLIGGAPQSWTSRRWGS
jgi:hypothetical protein